ncbi:hypothetical protein ACFL34_04405 [Candidatus Sumerlaeota bacterium]
MEIDIVIIKPVSKDVLLATIHSIFDKARKRTGFKHLRRPNCVVVSAFSSMDHFAAGAHHRVAEVSTVPANQNPVTRFNEKLFDQIGKPPLSRHGLSEAKRKKIYAECWHAIREAGRESEKQVPTDPVGLVCEGYTVTLRDGMTLMGALDAEEWFRLGTPSTKLPIGTRVTVKSITFKESKEKWAYVVARIPERPIEVGWLPAYMLGLEDPIFGQDKNSKDAHLALLHKQDAVRMGIQKRLFVAICSKHSVQEETRALIMTEGMTEEWAEKSLN